MKTIFCLSLLIAGSVGAQSWPWYGGPNHNGVVTNAPVTPGPQGAKVLWKVPMLGFGFTGPAIVGDQVFILDRAGRGETGEDVVRALMLATGKEVWTFRHPAPGDMHEDKIGLPHRRGPVSTVAVTDERVFVTGGFGVLYALDRATGKLVWKDAGTPAQVSWGVYSPSPLVVDGLVVVSRTVDPKTDELVAFQAATGKVAWRTVVELSPRPALVHSVHSSPVLATIGGVRQIVATHRQATFGADAQTGKVLWQYTGFQRGTVAAPPAVAADGRVYLCSGHSSGAIPSALIQVTKPGAEFVVREIYNYPANGRDVPPSERGNSEWQPGRWWNGLLYQVANHFNGHGLICADPDGRILWQTLGMKGRSAPRFGAQESLLIVNGIGLVTGGDGQLYFVALDPKEYRELGRVPVFTQAEMPEKGDNFIWAPGAYSAGHYVIRSPRWLACVQLGGK